MVSISTFQFENGAMTQREKRQSMTDTLEAFEGWRFSVVITIFHTFSQIQLFYPRNDDYGWNIVKYRKILQNIASFFFDLNFCSMNLNMTISIAIKNESFVLRFIELWILFDSFFGWIFHLLVVSRWFMKLVIRCRKTSCMSKRWNALKHTTWNYINISTMNIYREIPMIVFRVSTQQQFKERISHVNRWENVPFCLNTRCIRSSNFNKKKLFHFFEQQ